MKHHLLSLFLILNFIFISLCHAKSCTIQRVYCVFSASENTNCGILQHYHSNKSKVWNVCVSGKAERSFSDMYHHMTEELYRKYKQRKKNKNKHIKEKKRKKGEQRNKTRNQKEKKWWQGNKFKTISNINFSKNKNCHE